MRMIVTLFAIFGWVIARPNLAVAGGPSLDTRRRLRNMTGSIAPVEGSLLLGQSFLSRLGSWSIDNQRQTLILE